MPIDYNELIKQSIPGLFTLLGVLIGALLNVIVNNIQIRQSKLKVIRKLICRNMLLFDIANTTDLYKIVMWFQKVIQTGNINSSFLEKGRNLMIENYNDWFYDKLRTEINKNAKDYMEIALIIEEINPVLALKLKGQSSYLEIFNRYCDTLSKLRDGLNSYDFLEFIKKNPETTEMLEKTTKQITKMTRANAFQLSLNYDLVSLPQILLFFIKSSDRKSKKLILSLENELTHLNNP
jgi:hypothetical protein